jgi:hypothetical protein
MEWARIAGTFSLIVGLSLLVAFFTQFRNHGYVAWLGLSFGAISVASYLSRVNVHAERAAVVVVCVLFCIAFVCALNETRAQLRGIRRRQEAMEAQLLAMMESEREKRKKDE